MSKRKGNAASVDFILGLVFSIIGSVFVIVAVCFAVFQVQFEKNAVETSAVITRIESYRDGQGDSHHNVCISYEADGQTYEAVLESYVSSWYEGKTIEVLVSRDNPGEVRAAATSWLFVLIFGLVGFIFAVIGIIMSVLYVRKKKKKKWLRNNGRKIQAEVIGGRVCYNYTVNNRHPFAIECRYEDTGYGLLRHVLIRTGHVTGQIMVVLVLASPILPSKNNFVKALLKLHPEITTVVINVNNRNTSMVLGDKEHVIYGKGYIEDELCGKRFRISPKSFYQVNPVQTEILYGKALEYAGLTDKETVVDAYCGTGTIGMIASDKAGKVIGVELNADAVRDARNNAKANQIRNIQFYQNDAGKFLVEMAGQGAKVDVILMDPPRSGSTEEFMSSVVQIGPERIVYVSCNPETLVRDLKYFKKKGYRVAKGVGVDMFPFTDSLEAVVLMSRK